MCFRDVLLLFHLDMMALKVPMYYVDWRSCNEGVIVSRLSTGENGSAASRARRRHEDIADATVRVAEDFSSDTP
jgi:hypothetical protein